MEVLNSPIEVQSLTLKWKKEYTLALVPTMGCLHEGHISLVRFAKSVADKVVVSIFVNPLQFSQGEDYDKYPRTFERDRDLLKTEGVDLLFVPAVGDLYPKSFKTRVQVSDLGSGLCGAIRPGHFEGVATVCMKLFNITQPDVAIFGEKDFQQLQVLRQMALDLNLPVEIKGIPIVREADGLAMSSRNRYLSKTLRKKASAIPDALKESVQLWKTKKRVRAEDLIGPVEERLRQIGAEIDYVSVASESDLSPVDKRKLLSEVLHPRVFLAARLGETRLIDNMKLEM